MPKSKRNKVVALTQVKKKDRKWKESLVESIRDAVDTYPSVFVFRCKNMRNETFKSLRDDVSNTSRFFVGGNKLMRAALIGKESEEGLKTFAEHIVNNTNGKDDDDDDGGGGQKQQKETKKQQRGRQNEEFDLNTTTTGIVFTNLSKEDLMQAMEAKETKDFARVGQIATETIVCPEGPVKNCFDVPMSHTCLLYTSPSPRDRG